MRRSDPRQRDEVGVAFPSPLVMLSIIAVAMAGITFVVTYDNADEPEMTTVSQPSESPEPTESHAPKIEKPDKPRRPRVNRGNTVVEVYNNSGISGLAGETGGKASGSGWNVVATDNWYGTIPATTVYYPQRLKAAAQLLAKDLGISRVMPAVDPMRLDRLTVILTADYAS